MRPAKIQISLHIWAHILDSQGYKVSSYRQRKLIRLHNVQNDWSLHWAHMSEGKFSHVAAQYKNKYKNITSMFYITALRKYVYSNIHTISPPKTENFQIKKLIVFIFLLKT